MQWDSYRIQYHLNEICSIRQSNSPSESQVAGDWRYTSFLDKYIYLGMADVADSQMQCTIARYVLIYVSLSRIYCIQIWWWWWWWWWWLLSLSTIMIIHYHGLWWNIQIIEIISQWLFENIQSSTTISPRFQAGSGGPWQTPNPPMTSSQWWFSMCREINLSKNTSRGHWLNWRMNLGTCKYMSVSEYDENVDEWI